MAFCKNCGNNIPDGATFCSHCGTPVYDTTSQAQTQQHQYGTQQNNFLNSDDVTAEFDPMDIKENKVMAVLAYIGLLVLVPIFCGKGFKVRKISCNTGFEYYCFICCTGYYLLYFSHNYKHHIPWKYYFWSRRSFAYNTRFYKHNFVNCFYCSCNLRYCKRSTG